MPMTSGFEIWIHSGVARALGLALAHFLWEGAAIAAILVVALAISRGSSARLRYALACAALAAMPIAFGVTFAVSLPPSPARTIIPIPLPEPSHVRFENIAPAPPEPWKVSSLVGWAAPLWLAGVAGLLLYRFASWIAAQRLRRRGTCSAPKEWSRYVAALAAQLNISRPVALLESYLAEVPMVIGYLRPVILAPIGMLAGLPFDQVEAILLHELAHIRRVDYLVNLAQTMIESLLFYHPAVWWISNVVRAERENCCDDFVLSRDTDPRAYAAALLVIEQSRCVAEPGVEHGSMALAANGGHLVRRVRRILGTPRKSATPDSNLAIGPVALVILGAGIALAAWQPGVVKPTPSAIITPAPAANAPENLPVISIQPDGKMYLGDKPVGIHFMADEIARRYKGAKTVYVRADRETTYDPIAQLVSTLNLAKYDVKLVTPTLNRPVVSPSKSPRILIAQAQQPQPMANEQKKRQEQKLRQELESPYRKWLNEDVAYIITDAERKAFQALTTDNDREQFIEQFWKRRDPTPDTERNEYKEEHYRRIAYANDHFKTYIPGWKTDRGRIYIEYGPPNEIESHPAGGSYQRPAEQGGGTTTTFPFEQWRYRYIEGMGNNIILEFVDTARNGEYRLTTDPAVKDAMFYAPNVPVFLGRHASVAVHLTPRITAGVRNIDVTFVIPLDGSGPFHVVGEIATAGGKPVSSVEEPIHPPGSGIATWEQAFSEPGSYVFTAIVNGLRETINFEVK